MVAPEYVLSRTGKRDDPCAEQALTRRARTGRRPRAGRSPAAGRAAGALSADATTRNERSGSRRASSSEEPEVRRGSAPIGDDSRPPAGRTDQVGSARCPPRTRRTRPRGPSEPSHARSSSTSPHPYATIVWSRRNASAKTHAAQPGRSCVETLGKADRRVDDRRLHASQAPEQRQRDPDRVDRSSRRRPSGSARRATRGHERSRPSSLRRGCTLRSSTLAAARVSAPGSNCRLEVATQLEAGRAELVQPVQAVAGRVSGERAQRLGRSGESR